MHTRRNSSYLEVPGMKVTVTGGFWKEKRKIASDYIIPYQWKVLSDQIIGTQRSFALQNLKIAAGEFIGTVQGFPFQDTDVAKWLEAASYSLRFSKHAQIEYWIEEAIRLLGKAQRDDGYINSHFLSLEQQKKQGLPADQIKDRRWEDLKWGHELYTAGHIIEAGVAHYKSTGKKHFLSIVCKLADNLVQTFGKEDGKLHLCCGHPEIELALFHLYEVEEKETYKDLALYFLHIRGTNPQFFSRTQADKEDEFRRWLDTDYFAAHEPVRQMKKAAGHAVRAVYLYEAMADAALFTADPEMREALFTVWNNMVTKQMYITGGIGSQGWGERFTIDYDLPNSRAYTETCASIGLFFLSSKMFRLHTSSVYADIAERVLYNGILSGVSLDGTKYFYVNPLEVIPEVAEARQDHMWIKTQRVPWFGCACCPPNIARLITSIDTYMYAIKDGELFFQHYAESEARHESENFKIVIEQKTEYPWNGTISVSIKSYEGKAIPFNFRKPSWADSFTVSVNKKPVQNIRILNGYIRLEEEWKKDDLIEISIPMKVKYIFANPLVHENTGKAALQRGPILFCFESIENDENLASIVLDTKEAVSDGKAIISGCESLVLKTTAYREKPFESGDLYGEKKPSRKKTSVTAIPYHQWGNRGECEMRVWMRTI